MYVWGRETIVAIAIPAVPTSTSEMATDATAERENRVRAEAERRLREEQEEELDLANLGNICWAIMCGLLAVLIGGIAWASTQPIDPLDANCEEFTNDGVLRTVVWAGRVGGPTDGPNGPDTDWAVFFYKPYCGACRRIRPAFRALAATTNASGRLRFGEVNCVRDQRVCAMMGADKQPLVRIYRAKHLLQGGGGGQPQKGNFKREVAAEWQGLLIAYELVNWFVGLQTGPQKLIHASVAWPRDDELGEAMRRFKARGTSQVETSMTKRPSDPAGYMVDAELALVQGLTDHIFPTDAPLDGARLDALLTWLDLQARAPRPTPTSSQP